jgi:hypothetical protein
MELGDLTDSLLNMGKEKAKDLADNMLGEHEEAGGVTGAAAGFGRDMLGKVFGGEEQSDAGDNEESASDDDSDDSGDDNN